MAIQETLSKTDVPSFADIAKRIIKKSIRSAICIDDRFEHPYMTLDEIELRNQELSERDNEEIKLVSDLPRELYSSFRLIGQCDLDIYNFKNINDSWHPDYMLNNKDLMIIDWELDGKDGYHSTLQILQQAIDLNDFSIIPFIIIYTAKPAGDFNIIVREILTKFNPFGVNRETELLRFYNAFISSFDNCFYTNPSIEELDDFLDENHKILFEFWENTNKTVREGIVEKLCQNINVTFGVKEEKTPKTKSKLNTALEKNFGKGKNLLERLYYLSIEFKDDSSFIVKRVDSKDIGFTINSSILTIFSKAGVTNDGVKPEEVFETFSDLISKDPHNFLTLLSMEMRDKLRDDSYKIGNKISTLDERAFFYHLGNYQNRSNNYKNEFYDFLIQCWTNEIEAYNINQTPEVFKVLESYIRDRKLSQGEINKGDIHQQLADLAIKLSNITITDRINKDPEIRFGDIFKSILPDKSWGYFLCVTPQCVCVDACNKVDNNYFFIKSESTTTELKSALEKIEVDYYSLIKVDNVNLSINWGNCKPFSLWVRDNDFTKLKTKYTHFDITLIYVTTLKENFAQRLSNKAFSYGTSIGIDLPHLSKQ